MSGTTSGGNDWEIFLYDLDSQSVIQVTDDDSDDISPQTDGNYVVWQKHAAENGNQIFLYRIQGWNPDGGSKISLDDNRDNYAPKIAASQIVWLSQLVTQSFEPAQIMLYNATNQSGPVSLSDPDAECSDPRIDPGQVVWMQKSGDAPSTLYLYDLTSDNPAGQPAPDSFVWKGSPSVDGPRNVLTRYDGTDQEILLYSKSTGYSRITDNNLPDRYPVISQNHIAWIADKNIYCSDIASFMTVVITEHNLRWSTGFLASWAELSGGVDAYYLDVSTEPDFWSFVDGYRALNVGTVTQYTIEGLTPDTTYYYRVSASVNGSTTPQSKSMTVGLSTPTLTPSGVKALSFVYSLLLRKQ